MNSKITMTWQKEMLFDAEVGGHHILMDADEQWGGQNKGARPKPLILAALSGCSGMDVVSILKKMQITDYSFSVDVEAEPTEEQPVTYHTITMSFFFEGENLPADKVKKAVLLSTERYCAVHAMLSKAARIISKIYINNEEVL